MATTFKEIAKTIHSGVEKKDLDAILPAVTSCTNEQLNGVRDLYHENFKSVLHDDIKNALNSPTGNLLASFATPKFQHLAQSLHEALLDDGNKSEGALGDILGHITNADLTSLTAEYSKLYNKTPISDIRESADPFLKKALETVLAGKRVEHLPVDIKGTRVGETVEKFHQESEGTPTEPDYLVRFFTENPFALIRNVDQAYVKKYRHSIIEAAAKVLKGDLLVLAIHATLPKADYWAHRVHETFVYYEKGGKDVAKNEVLKRVIITNNESERDLKELNLAYKKTYLISYIVQEEAQD